MTRIFRHDIVVIKKKRTSVRKGKAMLQIHMISLMNLYRPYDLQGKAVAAAGKAEWLISTCLLKAGSSGYLGPDIAMCISE